MTSNRLSHMYVRMIENSHRCSFGDCSEKQNLSVLPIKKRHEILKRHKVFIPKQARMCVAHRANDDWTQRNEYVRNFTGRQLEEMAQLLDRNPIKKHSRPTVIATEKETGLSNEQFLQLFNSLPTLQQKAKTLRAQKKPSKFI